MAEVLKSITGEIKQSIARVELSTSALLDSNWGLTVIFEDATYDFDGKIMTDPTGSLRLDRKFGDIAPKVIPDTQVTIQQLAGLIQKACYMLRLEELAKPKTPDFVPVELSPYIAPEPTPPPSAPPPSNTSPSNTSPSNTSPSNTTPSNTSPSNTASSNTTPAANT